VSRLPVCVVNGPLERDAGELLLSRHTGESLSRIAAGCGGLRLIQYSFAGHVAESTGTRMAFRLSDHPQLHGEAIDYRFDHLLLRNLDRLRLRWRLLAALRSAPWGHHFLPGGLPLFACAASRFWGRPYGVYVRGVVDLESPAVRSALVGARVVICNNEHDAARLRGMALRVRVAAPMMDVGPKDLAPAPTARTGGTPTILFVGRHEEAKGLPELVEALTRLASEGLAFRFETVGTGPLADFERLPSALRDRARFHGFVGGKDELEAIYRGADLFVLPSHAEGFPRVLYEAMVNGLAIATTFVGGIPARMVDGGNCLRVEVRDPDSLAAAMRCLLLDAGLRRRLAAEGLETMRRLFAEAGADHAQIVLEELAAQ